MERERMDDTTAVQAGRTTREDISKTNKTTSKC